MTATAITATTWDDLVKIEPELRHVYDSVPRTVRSYLLPSRSNLRDVVGFVEGFEVAWRGARDRYEITHAVEADLDWFVGWRTRREALRTSAAWDTGARARHSVPGCLRARSAGRGGCLACPAAGGGGRSRMGCLAPRSPVVRSGMTGDEMRPNLTAALDAATAKLLREGKLEQSCPDCGRWEAAHSWCSFCSRVMGPADWYLNALEDERRTRRPKVAPAVVPNEYRNHARDWPREWGPFPADTLEMALAFARQVDADLVVSPVSSHYPGWTVRLEFWPPTLEVLA